MKLFCDLLLDDLFGDFKFVLYISLFINSEFIYVVMLGIGGEIWREDFLRSLVFSDMKKYIILNCGKLEISNF